MLKFLSSLSAWDWFDAVAIFMVLVGVVGGFFVGRIKHNLIDDLNDLVPVKAGRFIWTFRKNFLEFAFEGILIMGLAFELYGFKRHVTEAAELKEQAAGATNAAAQAMVQVEQFRQSNLLLQNRVEELRANNIALQAQQEPRVLEQVQFRETLRQYSGIEVAIVIGGGGDCEDIANQIANPLAEAGWKISAFRTDKGVASGISVGICSTDEKWSEAYDSFWSGRGHFGPPPPDLKRFSSACEAIADVLMKQNIDAKHDEHINDASNLRFNGVLIFVGKKPSVKESQLIRAQYEARKASEDATNRPDNAEAQRAASEKRDAIFKSMRTLAGSTNRGTYILKYSVKIP